MKLLRFGPPGAERPGLLLADGTQIDASAFGEDYGEAFFASRGLARLAEWIAQAGDLPRIPHKVRLGPPVTRPSKIVCVGLNYATTPKKAGSILPASPCYFLKHLRPFADLTTTLCCPAKRRTGR